MADFDLFKEVTPGHFNNKNIAEVRKMSYKFGKSKKNRQLRKRLDDDEDEVRGQDSEDEEVDLAKLQETRELQKLRKRYRRRAIRDQLGFQNHFLQSSKIDLNGCSPTCVSKDHWYLQMFSMLQSLVLFMLLSSKMKQRILAKQISMSYFPRGEDTKV